MSTLHAFSMTIMVCIDEYLNQIVLLLFEENGWSTRGIRTLNHQNNSNGYIECESERLGTLTILPVRQI